MKPTIPSRGLFAACLAVLLALNLAGLIGCAQAPMPVVKKEPPPVIKPAPPDPEASGKLPAEIDSPRFTRVTQVAQQEVAAGHTPGAVILVGYQDRVVYKKGFGQRTCTPATQAMTTDTVFDLASLTKVVATTTAVMQLADAGRLRLDDRAAKYWPEFAAQGKGHITIRQLMTHTSGLRADVKSNGSGYEGAMAGIANDHPINPPGTTFHYSDANFIALGIIVHKVSGLPLDLYCAKNIFGPMGLKETCFRPRQALQCRIAPCDIRSGQVHDPIAYRMGGVAGNAGVFSTADDMAVFAQMIVDRGMCRGKRILSPEAVATMTKPYSVPGNATRRGLGWDIRSPYSKIFNTAFPTGSFGHTGYTGTSIWIEPRSKTYLIILTNRLYPNGKGNVKALRARTAAAVAAAIPMGKPAIVASLTDLEDDPIMTGYGASDTPDRVRPGIDVLAAEGFTSLKGKNVGVITNHTGIDTAGRSTLNRLCQAPGVKVRAIFSPEHGLSGKLDEKVASCTDSATGLPVHSLYGKTLKPTPQMLKGLDALVYDIQDVGCRFYTYITTMAYAMEAAAAAGLDFYVLDRPDPICGAVVQGPVLDPDLRSFIGYYPLPLRYGMTAGELAQLFNKEKHIGARLHVVKMVGYRRDAWFDQTGLPWVNPSPNLRSLTQAILYPGVGLVESANLSVGRGTPTPFEIVGAPWISGNRLADYLNKRQIKGVAFEPVTFVPAAAPYRGQRCQGVRLKVVDRGALDSPALGIELASAVTRLYPGQFHLGNTLGMLGSRQALQGIKCGDDPREIQRRWQPGLEAFQRLRAKYLLY